jgi:hypothetical protein
VFIRLTGKESAEENEHGQGGSENMNILNKLAVAVTAVFLISAASVAQARSLDDGAEASAPMSFERSGPMGQLAQVSASFPMVTLEGCPSAIGPANRALDGITLENFAARSLASLTPCELRTLETQLGKGQESKASLHR